MSKISRFFIAMFFILFLVVPLFAEETGETVSEDAVEEILPVDDIILADELGEGVITGVVTGVDVELSTISVKIPDGDENTFSVIDGETILWKGIDDIELADVKEGDEAEVGYYTEGSGDLVASWVDVLIEEAAVPLEPAAEEKTEEKDSSAE